MMQFLTSQAGTHGCHSGEALRRGGTGKLLTHAAAGCRFVASINALARLDRFQHLDVSDSEGVDADRIRREHHQVRHLARLNGALRLLLEVLISGPERDGLECHYRRNPMLGADDLATAPCHTGHRGREHPHGIRERHWCVVVGGEDHPPRQRPAGG